MKIVWKNIAKAVATSIAFVAANAIAMLYAEPPVVLNIVWSFFVGCLSVGVSMLVWPPVEF